MTCGTPLRMSEHSIRQQNSDKSQTALIAGLIAATCVCIIVAVVAVVLLSGDNKEEPEPVPTLTPTVTESAEPFRRTPKPTQEPERTTTPTRVPYSPYNIYTNYDYSFSCPYPSDTYQISPLSSFTVYSLASTTDSGIIYVCATDRTGRSINQIADGFLEGHAWSTVQYDNRSSIDCSILVREGDTYYYCYYNMSDNKVRGFELSFNAYDYATYDRHISHMIANISFF